MMKIEIIKSNKDKQWVKEEYIPNTFSNPSKITIDLDKEGQTIFGFGGAFTDASEITFHSLSLDKQQEYLKAYFSKEGLNYNLGRYPIMSCDFSDHSYEYLSDPDINHFSMEEDKNRIAMIREVKKLQPNLWLIGAPWSPSTFMKDNNDRLHGGKLKKEYYSLWADVLLKTVSSLKEVGIEINCLTAQNEPLATQTWESCIYSSEEEATFLKDYLIPKAKKSNPNLKFMIFDHNRDKMLERADEMFDTGLSQKDIYGIAFHWYDHTFFEEVKKTHQKYPTMHLLMTEGCVELLREDNNGLGSWENGLRYGVNIIKDINNGCEGYIDWNLSLNKQGGPNHVGNFCEAPLMIGNNEIKYMPSYFVIGHFSKYMAKGSVVVSSISSDEELLALTAKKDDQIIINILNESKEDKPLKIEIGKLSSLEVNINPKSIYTFIITK